MNFKIGEIAIFHDPGYSAHGKEVLIIDTKSGVRRNPDGTEKFGFLYVIEVQDMGRTSPFGNPFAAFEHELRKHPPSQEQQDARNRHLAGCRERPSFSELMTELSPVSEETVKKVMENMGRLYGS